MGISTTQLNRAKERITESYLRQGIVPSASLINKDVEDSFKEKRAGLPRFTYREAVKNKKSKVEDYNSMLYEMLEDLIVSFDDTKRLSNEVLSVVSYYESNQIKVNRKLHDLEILNERLEETQLTGNKTVVTGDNFTDFKGIDFTGDKTRNIGTSTAFINLLTNDVEMNRKRGETYKHDLSNADIFFETNKGKIIHLSPLNAALKDTMYDAWRAIVETNDDSGLEGTIIVRFNKSVPISNIVIHMQNGRKLLTCLEVSNNDIDYKRLEERKIVNTYQWNIGTQPVSSLRFTVKHDEPNRSNGELFEYIFGIKKIEALEVLYEDRAVLVSQPFDVSHLKAIEAVTLEAEESVPPSTSIRYFFGIDDGVNMVEWREIRNNQRMVTGDVEDVTLYVDKYTPNYAKFLYEKYGAKFFSVCSIGEQITGTGTTVRMGRNMWLKEVIVAPFEYEKTDDESDAVVYPTGPHDWVRNMSSRKGFVRVQNRFDYLAVDQFHRYTVHIYAVDQEDVLATIGTTADSSHSVYINGAMTKGVGENYTLRLISGWNKIEIYAYARVPGEELIMDFYTPSMRNDIFGLKENLTEISLYDLMHNTTTRTLTKFALDDKEKQSIIVNYDPKRLDIQSDFTEGAKGEGKEKVRVYGDGIEYEVTYKKAEELYDNLKIRFMAVLSKENAQIETTPLLKGYKLKFE